MTPEELRRRILLARSIVQAGEALTVTSLHDAVTEYFRALDAWNETGFGREEARLNRAEKALREIAGVP